MYNRLNILSLLLILHLTNMLVLLNWATLWRQWFFLSTYILRLLWKETWNCVCFNNVDFYNSIENARCYNAVKKSGFQYRADIYRQIHICTFPTYESIGKSEDFAWTFRAIVPGHFFKTRITAYLLCITWNMSHRYGYVFYLGAKKHDEIIMCFIYLY